MTPYNTRSGLLRGISLFVAIAFAVTTITINPSGAMAYTGTFDFLGQNQLKNELQKHLSALPSELGSVVRSWDSSQLEAGKPFVIQIQDAHSNPEAEQSIAGILKYLEQKFPEMIVGLEGAKGPLHPEYFQFFKDFPEANQAVIDDLRQKGELNGVELYLWEKYQKTPSPVLSQGERDGVRGLQSPVFGVENAELYRENLKTFRDLLFRRDEIQTLLNPLRAQLEKGSSKVLNPELREFLKERDRRKDGRFNASQGDPDLAAYVRYLKAQSLKVLKIDLTDVIEQLRFPNLIRVVLSEEEQKGFDTELAQKEWGDVLSVLKTSAKEKSAIEFVKALETYGREQGLLPQLEGEQFSYPIEKSLYPRKLLEGLMLFSEKHPLDLNAYGAFLKSWRVLVFRSEIDITGLTEEMTSLEENILEKLVKTEAEKKLIERFKDLNLLTKLLHLELTRPEYEKVLERREAITDLLSQSKTGDQRPETQISDLKSQISTLKSFFETALHFYDVSIQRDHALLNNALSLAVPRTPNSVLVLMAGGFHTAGVEELLREKGIGYAVVSPRIRTVDHGERYQKVMAGGNADLSAYFKVKNPFSTEQEAIFFKQLIETAAPALFEKYQTTPDDVAAHVKQAVDAHPVLSKAMMVQPGADRASLQFETGSRNPTPQNAAIPRPCLADGNFPELVDPVRPLRENAPTKISIQFFGRKTFEVQIREEPVKQPSGFDWVGLDRELGKLVLMGNGVSSPFDTAVADLLEAVGDVREGDNPEALNAKRFQNLAEDVLVQAEAAGISDVEPVREILKPFLRSVPQTGVARDALNHPTVPIKVGKIRSESRTTDEIAKDFRGLIYLPEDAQRIEKTSLSDVINYRGYKHISADIEPIERALADGKLKIASDITGTLLGYWITNDTKGYVKNYEAFGRFIEELGEIGLLDAEKINVLVQLMFRNYRLQSGPLGDLVRRLGGNGLLTDEQVKSFVQQIQKRQEDEKSETQIISIVGEDLRPVRPGSKTPPIRSETREGEEEPASDIKLEIAGEATGPGSFVGKVANFTNALPGEILFQVPKNEFLKEAEKLGLIVEEVSKNYKKEDRDFLKGQTSAVLEQIKSDLFFNRHAETVNLVGALLRRLHDIAATQPQKADKFQRVMDALEFEAIKRIQFSGPPEEEIESAKKVLDEFIRDHEKKRQDSKKRMDDAEKAAVAFAKIVQVDLSVPEELSDEPDIRFEKLAKALKGNKNKSSEFQALEAIVEMYRSYKVEKSLGMEGAELLRKAKSYFDTDRHTQETLQRMKKERKNFAAIFYEDVILERDKKDGVKGFGESESLAIRLISAFNFRKSRMPTWKIEVPENAGEGFALYISELMGVDTMAEIMAKFGDQIKAIVTSNASLSSHWVVVLQQYPKPPPVLIINPREDERRHLGRLKAGDEVLVSGKKKKLMVSPNPDDILEEKEEQRKTHLLQTAEQGTAHILNPQVRILASTVVGEPNQSAIDAKAEGVGLNRSEVDKELTEFINAIAKAIRAENIANEDFERAVDDLRRFLEESYRFKSSDDSGAAAVTQVLVSAIREVVSVNPAQPGRVEILSKIIFSAREKLESYYQGRRDTAVQDDEWLIEFIGSLGDAQEHMDVLDTWLPMFRSYLERKYFAGSVGRSRGDIPSGEANSKVKQLVASLTAVPPSPEQFLKNLRLHLEPRYRAQLEDQYFTGKDYVFRTFDFWADKNSDLFNLLFNSLGFSNDEWTQFMEQYSGFNFYRTPLGRQVLIQQIAVLIMVQGKLFRIHNGKVPNLKIMFPQVDGVEDVEFISREILDEAEALALQTLEGHSQDGSRELMREALGKISYGSMVETPKAVSELEAILNFKRHGKPLVEFVSVGNNDLEMKLLEEYLLEKTGIRIHANRDYAWAKPWIKKLNPLNIKTYRAIADTVAKLNKNTGRKVLLSFCGEVAAEEKFILFSKYLKKLYGDDLPIVLSESPNKIAHSRSVARQIGPSFDFSFMEDLDEDSDSTLEEIAKNTYKKIENILVVLENWQARYEKAGFDNAFYRLTIDPIDGVGSFAEFNFLKQLVLNLLDQNNSPAAKSLKKRLQLDPKKEINRGELERILKYYPADGILDVSQPGSSPELSEQNQILLQQFDFLENVRDVFKSYVEKNKMKQNVLHPSFVNDFLKYYRKVNEDAKHPVDWLPTNPGKTFQAFSKEYRKASTNVFDNIILLSRRFLSGQLPPKLTHDEQDISDWVVRAGFRADQIDIEAFEGFAFRRNAGWDYGQYREMDIKNAVSLFDEHPEFILDVFYLAAEHNVRIGEKTQQAILQSRARLEDLTEKIRNKEPGSEEAASHIHTVFQEIISSKKSVYYALWRMHGLEIFDAFVPFYGDMRAFFKSGQRYSVDLQTMRALEIIDQLKKEEEDNNFYLLPKEILARIKEKGSLMAVLRYSVFMDGIVRAKAGEGASERDIREIADETLVAMGAEKKILDDVVWLLAKLREVREKDLLSQEQVEVLWKKLNADPGLTQDRWDLLYLMTFSSRMSRVEPEKTSMLIRLGQYSPLFHITQLFLMSPEEKEQGKKPEFQDKRFEDGAWKWVEENNEHYDFKELVEGYLKQTAHGNISDLRSQLVRLLGIQETRENEGTFDDAFEKFLQFMSSAYIHALNPSEIVQALLFYVHLQLLKTEKIKNTVPTLFQKMPSHGREAYEILIGYPEYKEELVAIFSKVLFKNGFVLEEAAPHFSEGDVAAVRFMGYFRRERGDEILVQSKIKKIQEDLQSIFHSQEEGIREFIKNMFGSKDTLFERLEALYGDLEPEFHRDYENWQDVKTEVRFLGPDHFSEISNAPFTLEEIGNDKDVLYIETSDREGLLSAISFLLYAEGGVGVERFVFDDVNTTSPKGFFLVSKNGKKLDAGLKKRLVERLKRGLTAHEDKPEVKKAKVPRDVNSTEPGLFETIGEPDPGATQASGKPEGSTHPFEDTVIIQVVNEPADTVVDERFYELRGEGGFHARPTAKLVDFVTKKYAALKPRMKNANGKDADMTSVMGVMGLGAEKGARISISVRIPQNSETGAKAAESFFRRLELGQDEDGYLFGDDEPLVSDQDKSFLKRISPEEFAAPRSEEPSPEETSATDKDDMASAEGAPTVEEATLPKEEIVPLEKVIMEGNPEIKGTVQIDPRETFSDIVKAATKEVAEGDVDRAIADAVSQVEAEQNSPIFSDYAQMIFDAHLLMIKDVELKKKFTSRMSQGMSTSQAILEGGKEYYDFFANSSSSFLKEKAVDVADVTLRILRNLSGRKTEPAPENYKGKIVVTRTLYPSDFFERYRGAKAIIVVGGIETHNSQLARDQKIPLIAISEENFKRITAGAELSLDKEKGELTVVRSELRSRRKAEPAGFMAGFRQVVRSVKIIFWTELILLPPTLWAYPSLLESFKNRFAERESPGDLPAKVLHIEKESQKNTPNYFQVETPDVRILKSPATSGAEISSQNKAGAKDQEQALRAILSAMDRDQNYRIFKNLLGVDPSISIEKRVKVLSGLTSQDLLRQFAKKTGVSPQVFIQASEENKLPLEMLFAVILRETSNFDTDAVNQNKPKDKNNPREVVYPDVGVCQINLATAADPRFLKEALRRGILRTSKRSFNLSNKADRDELTRLLKDPVTNIRYEALIFSGHSDDVTQGVEKLVKHFGAEGFLGLGDQFIRSPEWVKFLFAANNIGPTGVVKKVQAKLAKGGPTNAFSHFFPQAKYVPPAANYFELTRRIMRNNPAQFARRSEVRGEKAEEFLKKVQDPKTYPEAKVLLEKYPLEVATQETFETLLDLMALPGANLGRQLMIAEILPSMVNKNPLELAIVDNVALIMQALGKLWKGKTDENILIKNIVLKLTDLANDIPALGEKASRSELRAEEDTKLVLDVIRELQGQTDVTQIVGMLKKLQGLSFWGVEGLTKRLPVYMRIKKDADLEVESQVKQGVKTFRDVQGEWQIGLVNEWIIFLLWKGHWGAIADMLGMLDQPEGGRVLAEFLSLMAKALPLAAQLKAAGNDSEESLILLYTSDMAQLQSFYRVLLQQEIERMMNAFLGDKTISSHELIERLKQYKEDLKGWPLEKLLGEYPRILKRHGRSEYIKVSPLDFETLDEFESNLRDTFHPYLEMMLSPEMRGRFEGENTQGIEQSAQDLFVLWEIWSRGRDPQTEEIIRARYSGQPAGRSETRDTDKVLEVIKAVEKISDPDAYAEVMEALNPLMTDLEVIEFQGADRIQTLINLKQAVSARVSTEGIISEQRRDDLTDPLNVILPSEWILHILIQGYWGVIENIWAMSEDDQETYLKLVVRANLLYRKIKGKDGFLNPEKVKKAQGRLQEFMEQYGADITEPSQLSVVTKADDIKAMIMAMSWALFDVDEEGNKIQEYAHKLGEVIQPLLDAEILKEGVLDFSDNVKKGRFVLDNLESIHEVGMELMRFMKEMQRAAETDVTIKALYDTLSGGDPLVIYDLNNPRIVSTTDFAIKELKREGVGVDNESKEILKGDLNRVLRVINLLKNLNAIQLFRIDQDGKKESIYLSLQDWNRMPAQNSEEQRAFNAMEAGKIGLPEEIKRNQEVKVFPMISSVRLAEQATNVTNPLAGQEESQVQLPTTQHRRRKILIADDEESNLQLMPRMIDATVFKERANESAQYFLAKDGEEAQKICEENPDIELIITDIMMPKKTGPQFIKALKQTGRKLPRLIVMSGYNSDNLTGLEEEMKTASFLPKPYSMKSLGDAVDVNLPRSEIRVGQEEIQDVAHALGIADPLDQQTLHGLSLEEFADRKHLFAETSPEHPVGVFGINESYKNRMAWYHRERTGLHDIEKFILTEAVAVNKEQETRARLQAMVRKVQGKDLKVKKRELFHLFKWAADKETLMKYQEIVSQNKEKGWLFGEKGLDLRAMKLQEMPWIPIVPAPLGAPGSAQYWEIDQALLQMLSDKQETILPQRYYGGVGQIRRVSLEELARLRQEGIVKEPKLVPKPPVAVQTTLDFGSTKPAVQKVEEKRAELRIVGTAEYKKGLLDTISSEQLPMDESMLNAIDRTAETLGNIFSEKGLESYATEWSEVQIRAWIAMQLLMPLRAAVERQGVKEERLRQVLQDIESFVGAGRPAAAQDVSVRQELVLHSHMPKLGDQVWEQFKLKLPVLLGALVMLRAKLFINIDVEERVAERMQREAAEIAAQNGIVLDEQAIVFRGVLGKNPMSSLSLDKRVNGRLAEEERMVPASERHGSRWLYSDGALSDGSVLATNITTVLYALMDPRISLSELHTPSQFDKLFEVVRNAIEGYQAIRQAA